MSGTEPKPRIRILIVDDHPSVREALAARVGRQDDLEVCGEAADVGEALRLAAETRPDVAVVDISLKGGNGIDLIRRLTAKDACLRAVVWSMHSETLYAERALRAGARGYVSKDLATETILEAIRRVLEGKIWLSEAVADRLLNRAVGPGTQEVKRPPLETLSKREREVFRLIGQALGTGEIARRLHISVKTVDTYRDRIRAKLELKDGTELARAAMLWVLEQSRRPSE
jgi:DNA-binding NarL/FixJ family response regulator